MHRFILFIVELVELFVTCLCISITTSACGDESAAILSPELITNQLLCPPVCLQIQIKDFRFSYKFKTACKEDVLKLCPNIKKK